jgi:hypothetical protein
VIGTYFMIHNMCINKGTLLQLGRPFPPCPHFPLRFNCNNTNSYKTQYIFDKGQAVWFYISGRCKKWNTYASWKCCLLNVSTSHIL